MTYRELFVLTVLTTLCVVVLEGCSHATDDGPPDLCDTEYVRSRARALQCPCQSTEYCLTACNGTLDIPDNSGVCVPRCVVGDDDNRQCQSQGVRCQPHTGADTPVCLPPHR